MEVSFSRMRSPMSRLTSFWFAITASLGLAFMGGCVHSRDAEEAEPEEYHESQPLPAAPSMLLESAEQHFAQGRLTMAHSQAERVYRLEPRNYRVIFLLARIAYENKSPEDAEQWAYKALDALQPQFTAERRKVWEFIATCRRDQGQIDAAEEALREAHRLRKD